MKNDFTNATSNKKHVVYLLGAVILVLGLLFSASAQPALASVQMQAATTGTPTVGPTTAATTSGTSTPAAGAATTTVVPTLAAPSLSGTPTALVPVTGADLTPPGSGWATALRIFAGLLGLLLIGFGLRSYRLGKR